MNYLTLSVPNRSYAYANRLDPGQPPSNLAAGLRSNLFATQSFIPHKKKQNLKVLKSRRQYNLFLAHLAHSAKVSFWDRVVSVVRRPATIYLNIFFSDSTGPRVLIFGM